MGIATLPSSLVFGALYQVHGALLAFGWGAALAIVAVTLVEGVILLGHRVPATSLHWTSDEGKKWHGSVRIDSVGGGYPSMVELPDSGVYCVYY
jgi:hypothetical protein